MHVSTADEHGQGDLAIESLSDDAAAETVDRLKAEADRHYWINANRSLELAEQVVHIGRTRDNPRHTALGLMTRGDALKFLGHTEDAWAALGEAGALFLECGDEVGWARTRIGRLLICVDLGRVAEALADAERARAIFARHGVREKQVVLDLNAGIVYNLLGDQQGALALYHDAIGLAESLGAAGAPYLGLLYNCTGVAYNALGGFRDALRYYERAYTVFLQRQERSAAEHRLYRYGAWRLPTRASAAPRCLPTQSCRRPAAGRSPGQAQDGRVLSAAQPLR
jgi:tetratricopeptide (TPR) repeat protein